LRNLTARPSMCAVICPTVMTVWTWVQS